jgi:TRAP-type C4-dicarboxylate transport system permease small subunit
MAIVLAGAIAVIVAAGVFWRYVLNDSLTWSEELSKFCMLWLVFVGAPIALRFGNHVAIEIVPSLLARRARAALAALALLLVAIFLAVLTWKGFVFAWNGRTQSAIAIGDISMIWIFISIPLGAAVMLLVSVQMMLEQVMRLFGEEPPEDSFIRAHRAAIAEVEVS